MPLPVPLLDDRRFADLVAEARQRIAAHNPEWTNVVPGDPADALLELFAWLAETVLYRVNLIPERQRRAFLRLLALPMRAARPARGIVCIDSVMPDHARLPSPVKKGARLAAGATALSVDGDLQPMPFKLAVVVKRPITKAELLKEGITPEQLAELFGRAKRPIAPVPYRPVTLVPGKDPIELKGTLDRSIHLALAVPKERKVQAENVRRAVAGKVLSLALAPRVEGAAVEAEAAPVPRRLTVELAHVEENGDVRWLPLEVESDTSLAVRRAGVLRLRLPARHDKLAPPIYSDPHDSGVGDGPPPPPDSLAEDPLALWLKLSCREDPQLSLGYVGVNGVEVVAQVEVRGEMLGVGSGEPEQPLRLARPAVDSGSLDLEVEAGREFEKWRRVDHFGGAERDHKVFVFDAEAGVVRCGDGIRGARFPKGARVRLASYRAGGGLEGNLPPGSIQSFPEGGNFVKVRHEWPLRGGVDAETVEQAERRIPAYLRHRDRAVTSEDYAQLALDQPLSPVARADVVRGLIPNASPALVREGVPGAVSLFVLPPALVALGAVPRSTPALLRDLFGYLRERCTLGTELYVLAPRYRALAVSVSVTVDDASAEMTTLAAIEGALNRFLWPLPPEGPHARGWPLGRAVDPAELSTQVARVPGVRAVTGLRLWSREPSGWREVEARHRLELERYELPELAAVSAQAGGGPPDRPPLTRTPDGHEPTGVPVPVVPELC